MDVVLKTFWRFSPAKGVRTWSKRAFRACCFVCVYIPALSNSSLHLHEREDYGRRNVEILSVLFTARYSAAVFLRNTLAFLSQIPCRLTRDMR